MYQTENVNISRPSLPSRIYILTFEPLIFPGGSKVKIYMHEGTEGLGMRLDIVSVQQNIINVWTITLCIQKFTTWHRDNLMFLLIMSPMQGSSPSSVVVASWYFLWQRTSFCDGLGSEYGWLWYQPTTVRPRDAIKDRICPKPPHNNNEAK